MSTSFGRYTSMLEDLEKERKRVEEEKKKKEEEEKASQSFTDYTKQVLGKTEEDDIAPVREHGDEISISDVNEAFKKHKKKANEGWFSASELWDDGYDMWDVSKTVGYTLADIGKGIVTGVVGMGEAIADAGAWLGQALTENELRKAEQNEIMLNIITGHPEKNEGLDEKFEGYIDQSEQESADFIAKDLYDEKAVVDYLFTEDFANSIDANSVFGTKADSLAQSAGQMGVAVLGQVAGIPWWLTMGATTFGGEMDNALNNDATYQEASTSALISAGAEVLTEKIGGISFGGKTLTGYATNALSSNISNSVARSLAKFGIEAGTEGFEEIFSGAISAVGQKLTYASEKDFNELFSTEDAFDSFIGGLALGGWGQVKDIAKSYKNGTDYVTGLKNNEQSVVDKVYQDALTKAEESGEKPNKKKIYNEILEDFESGGLSIGDIESVLGGDTYNSYNEMQGNLDTLLSERKALRDEYDALEDIKDNELTGKQRKRIAELESLLEGNNTKISDSHKQLMEYLKDSSSNIAKDSKLLESYYERVRRDQKLDVDLNQYDGEVKEYLKNLMEKGQVNNTNKAKKFWLDFVPKVIKDKGIKVTSTTTKEILARETKIHGAEYVKKNFTGVIPNAYILDDGTIALNVDSPNSRWAFFGHEIGHTMETHSDYGKLQEILFSYAEAKEGDAFKQRKATVEGLYKNIDGAKVNVELTNDLLGEYIFDGDTEFIKKLSVENRGLLKTIWDELKYLCKLATAGSKEKRDLVRAEHMVAEIYRESGKVKTKSNGKTDYSLSLVDSVQPTTEGWQRTLTTDEVKKRFPNLWDVSAEDSDVRNPTQISGTVKSYRKVYDYLESEGFDGTILDASSGLGYGTKAGIEEYGFDVEDIEPFPDADYNPKYRDYSALDKQYDVVISNAVLNVLPQDQRDALVVKMGEMLNEGGRMFINVRGDDVKNASSKVAINEDLMEYYISKSGSYQKGFTPNELKAYLEDVLGDGFTVEKTRMFGKVSAIVTKNSGVKYSLSKDSDGKALTKGQSDYFKDSKMRDDDGNLKVMYHGSQDAGFHEFEQLFSDDSTSFFFVDNPKVAKSYSGTDETYTARTFRTAEDFNNFFEEIGADEYNVKEEMHGNNKWFVLYEDGVEVASSETAKMLYDEFRDWTGLGTGSANYKAYLNLQNPLTVDAEGRNWDEVTREYSQKIADRYNSLTAEEKEALADLAGWGDFGLFKGTIADAKNTYAPDGYTELLTSAYEKLGGDEGVLNFYDLHSIASENFSEESIKQFAVEQLTTRDYAQRAKEQGYDGVIFKNIVDNGAYASGMDRFASSTVAIAFDSNQIKSVANENPTSNPDIRYSLSGIDGKPIESDRVSSDEFDVKYSLTYNPQIAKGQMDYLNNKDAYISVDELEEAQKVTNAMVDVMMKYSSILPEDKIGKVLTKNGSYDRSVENTTICVRTLAYNEFVDKVQEEIGRPLTQMESFLVSQKLYDIATEPQCLYCYVSLDRKAFNDMLLRYMQDRDTVIAKYNNSDKSTETISKLYEEFLNGRKDTKNMKERFNKWIGYVDNGTQLLSLADIATESRQSEINANGGILADQLKDARAYAQSASWSKIQKNYVAYRDEILKLNNRVVKNLNEHYGMRWYSFSDYSPAFIVENMQQITDASIRGLKGLAYTKDTDFAEIFAPSGMNVNISVFVNQDADGNFFIDEKQSANFEKAKALREKYPNIGIVATVTNDEALRWAGEQEWSDVIIPFHIVRTGTDVAEYYKWLNYTSESADTIGNKDLWESYLDSLNLKSENARKKVSKNIYPNEHKNNKDTYLNLCESRGLSPRFVRFAGEDWYMKLVNETRLSADESSPLKPLYNLDVAKESFQRFVDKGGYEGGWYRDGVDVDAEASIVANDVLAGKKANEVDYGRQDGFVPEDILSRRKTNRKHGQFSLSTNTDHPVRGAMSETRYMPKDDFAPMREDISTTENIVDNSTPITEQEANTLARENLNSLDDADAPPEVEAPYYESTTPLDPFDDRDIKAVGNRKVKAYMYENPEVKPFFQEEARMMLGELNNTTRGERFYTPTEYSNEYGAESYGHWTGVSRQTSEDIAYLLDGLNYTYEQIEKGLKAIIEDNGAENNACSKRIEFLLNDRLLKGYQDMTLGVEIPPNQDYINLLNEKQITEYNEEAKRRFYESIEANDYVAPVEDIAPTQKSISEMYGAMPVTENEMASTQENEAIKPKPEALEGEEAQWAKNKMTRADKTDANPRGKRRKWVGTSTESEAVDGKVLPDDLDQSAIHYQPIPNKKTLGNANARLNGMGYDASLAYFNSQFSNKQVSLDDIALGERLIQEAVKRGDTKTAGELIQNVAILGTELGQKVQALSIIKRLTPEGQLGMLQKIVERGKTKGDKAYEGVEFTQEMIDHILKTYGKDGTFDQAELNKAVEDVKQKIADQMKVSKMDKVNAWRYLAMLGNPKTHIRNLVSNVAMRGTVAVKNVVARTIETIAPIKNRTKTWKSASEDVKAFAQKTTAEMKDILSDGGKYSEDASIKEKRAIFKNKILNGVYEFNSNLLTKEDWWFSKPAFTNALSEYLTANGISTAEDIQNNPEIVEKAKQYATEQSQIATFRQYSWLSNKINEIERKNAFTQMAVGSVLPFKKTPVNIAKTALNYSPIGFAKTLTYDISQVKKGNMEASEMVDHLAQNLTGSALTLVGYMLASAGFLNGGGEDDKEGEYDYQLGKQAYSVNIGDATLSLSWLSPIAMPLFVGVNAYEQLVEGKEWNGDVVVETLAQTLDPLSEMSFLSSLDDVLSSYDSGVEKFAGIGESMVQNYATQFAPTLLSQVAQVMDDTKRSTKVSADSDFKFVEETINKLKYKIPFLRNTLEPSTDIWGNEVKQTEDIFARAFETFLAPYSKREDISTAIDEEIKALYRQTGDTGLIPSIPYNYINYDGAKYEMSAEEYTEFKKAYGQNSLALMKKLFDTETYKNASSEEKAELVNKVYDYARDEAKKAYFAKYGVDFTNAESKEKGEYYKENSIKGAIDNDMMPDEYEFYTENPEKYAVAKAVGGYDSYRTYSKELYNIKADKDSNGKSISGSRKEKVLDYINNLDIDYGEKIILFKSEYNADDTYNYEIVEYLNSRDDISYEEMETILKELGFKVDSKGNISWD